MFFPKITEDTFRPLKAAADLARHHEGYLDSPDCPYSDEIKEFLRARQVAIQTQKADIFDVEGDKNEIIEREITGLINELKQFGTQLTNKDHSEKIQFFKTYTGVLEKLVVLKERVFNIQEMATFQSVVIRLMEEVLSKDQIAELMSRLRNLKSVSQ
ncbi:hypothetical protein IZ6_25280 [Terrihabitans soli]|uniref:Uncharacterized protein n=1 Tax=Terrihabitans soli TaxID=708113 RepID=A0A6S6QKG0_9HYPH|nr:hypothetical protein [Terrihabitans soli]BCJ91793.1 hypothetical protein IZ6_25280 [Terrihabitans soli]